MPNLGNLTNLGLKDIIAPALSNPQYGIDLATQFQNISDNFQILAQKDFVKGDKGLSIRIVKYPLIFNDNITIVGLGVLDAIYRKFIAETNGSTNNTFENIYDALAVNLSNPDNIDNKQLVEDEVLSNGIMMVTLKDLFELSPKSTSIDSISCLDLMNEADCFIVAESYDPAESVPAYHPECALNGYVFKDKRFVTATNISDISSYSSLTDMSCVVYMNGDIATGDPSYIILQETPSLYYDADIDRFCWLINGQKSGMIAQGPAGSNGTSAVFHLFKHIADGEAKDETGNTIHPGYYADPLNPIWGDVSQADTSQFHIGDACMLFWEYTDDDGNKSTEIYFSKIVGVTSNDVEVLFSHDCRITWFFDETILNNLMDGAYKGSDHLQNIHVFYENANNGKYIHALWSDGGSGVYPTLHISPINESLSTNSILQASNIDSSKISAINIDYPHVNIGYGNRKEVRIGNIIIVDDANTGSSISSSKTMEVKVDTIESGVSNDWIRMDGCYDDGITISRGWNENHNDGIYFNGGSDGTLLRRTYHLSASKCGHKNNITVQIGGLYNVRAVSTDIPPVSIQGQTDPFMIGDIQVTGPLYFTFSGFKEGTLLHVKYKIATKTPKLFWIKNNDDGSTRTDPMVTNLIYFYNAITKNEYDKYLDADLSKLQEVIVNTGGGGLVPTIPNYTQGYIIVDALVYITKLNTGATDNSNQYLLLGSGVTYEDFNIGFNPGWNQ